MGVKFTGDYPQRSDLRCFILDSSKLKQNHFIPSKHFIAWKIVQKDNENVTKICEKALVTPQRTYSCSITNNSTISVRKKRVCHT